MPKHLPQSSQRTNQIKKHNAKALAEGRPDDVLPEQSATKIWEPHEYNAEIAKRAKARGDRVNIPGANGQPGPRVPQGYVMATEAPEMRDLENEAKERAQTLRAPKGSKKGQFRGGIRTEKPDPQ